MKLNGGLSRPVLGNRVTNGDTNFGGRLVGRMSIFTVAGAEVSAPLSAAYVNEVCCAVRGSTGAAICACVPNTLVAGVAKLLGNGTVVGTVPSSLMLLPK